MRDNAQGLTLLSLCPGAHCGYYVLRYPNGLSHWDRDIEAARLLRTLLHDENGWGARVSVVSDNVLWSQRY